MRRIHYMILGCAVLLMASCQGSRQAPKATSPYSRPPQVEVTEEQLKTDAAQIEATTQQLIGNLEEALQLYQKLVAANPNYSPAHYEMGRLYLASGWLDSALLHTRTACRLDDNNEWYRLQLAQVYERMRDSKNLIATWEDLVRRYPDKVEYYYNLSNAYLYAENVTGSIEALDRVERRFGVRGEVSLQKQKLWNAIKRPDKARRELEQLAAAVPGDTRYNAILAEGYMAEKNYSKALQFYNRILENDPSDENIRLSLASCYLTMGNLPMTYLYLSQGVQHPSIDCQHRLQFLAKFMLNRDFFAGYSKQCFALADSLVARCAQSDGGYHMLYGNLLASQERYADAAEQFRQHLAEDRSQWVTWEALLLCDSKDTLHRELLMEEAQQAAELFPLQLRPYLILGEGYLEMGDCQQARHYVDRCLMLAPNETSVKQLKQKIQQQCQ